MAIFNTAQLSIVSHLCLVLLILNLKNKTQNELLLRKTFIAGRYKATFIYFPTLGTLRYIQEKFSPTLCVINSPKKPLHGFFYGIRNLAIIHFPNQNKKFTPTIKNIPFKIFTEFHDTIYFYYNDI